MILLRLAAIVVVLSLLVTGCAIPERIAALEAKVQRLEKVADYL